MLLKIIIGILLIGFVLNAIFIAAGIGMSIASAIIIGLFYLFSYLFLGLYKVFTGLFKILRSLFVGKIK